MLFRLAKCIFNISLYFNLITVAKIEIKYHNCQLMVLSYDEELHKIIMIDPD